jgi:hypothetical protein
VVLFSGVITMGTPDELLEPNFPSPPYRALIVYVPPTNSFVDPVAMPLVSR